MEENDELVVWNGSLGVLDTARLGQISYLDGIRQASLAPPYDMVGPFKLDELQQQGRVAFGACLVMSRERWRLDQLRLRQEARAQRRAMRPRDAEEDQDHREALDLPAQGILTAPEISAAFRKRAKTAHPDAGGSNEHYRRISQARDALMEQLADS